MSPACAGPSDKYSMLRFSFWNWLIAVSMIDGTFNSPLMLCASLPAQHHVALFGDIAAFGETGLADDLLEAGAVEFAVGRQEAGVAGDALRDIGVGQAEPEILGLFVERGFRHQLTEQLPVEAEAARLVGRDRPADPAADLLQLVGVILAKLLDRNFGAADLGHRIGAEAAENVADAPDREADDQAAHDDGHEGLADPGRSGFVDTAKHARVFPGRW